MNIKEEFEKPKSNYSILDKLRYDNICWFDIDDDNDVQVQECCDYYFNSYLTAQDCNQLSEFFFKLANLLTQFKGGKNG